MVFDKICGFASLLGFILTVTGCFTTDCHKSAIWILVMILFLLLSIFYFCKYTTATKYLRGEAEIRDAHNKIALQYEQIRTKNLEGIVHIMSDLCTEIAEAFEIIKGQKVGVCIKYINGDITNPYVETLCRDIHSRKRSYPTRTSGCDYIWQNTDFAHILKSFNQQYEFAELYFFANDLPNQYQYTNTHLDASNLQSGFLRRFKRRKQWTLPYQSTIVVPFLSPDNKQVEGFLCIDCSAPKGFNKSRDVVILQQIALFMRELMCYVCSNHLKEN